MTLTRMKNGKRVTLSAEEEAAWQAAQPTESEIEVAAHTGKIAAIKAEAARHIVEVLPEWQQRNTSARGLEIVVLALLRLADYMNFEIFTEAEMIEIVGGQQVWDQIKAIRAASNALEQLSPIPKDITNDIHWP